MPRRPSVHPTAPVPARGVAGCGSAGTRRSAGGSFALSGGAPAQAWRYAVAARFHRPPNDRPRRPRPGRLWTTPLCDTGQWMAVWLCLWRLSGCLWLCLDELCPPTGPVPAPVPVPVVGGGKAPAPAWTHAGPPVHTQSRAGEPSRSPLCGAGRPFKPSPARRRPPPSHARPSPACERAHAQRGEGEGSPASDRGARVARAWVRAEAWDMRRARAQRVPYHRRSSRRT